MKWHNFNLSVRIKLSAGTKILIFVICVFVLLGLSCLSTVISEKYDAAILALAAALGVGLFEGYKSNKLDVEAAEKNLGTKLNQIKLQAAGECVPGEETK